MSKSTLNELCQKENWEFPMYSYIKHGKEHSPLFRGVVEVHGLRFVSQSTFNSSKSAYNDVAQQALNHFTSSTLSPTDMKNAKRQKVCTTSAGGSNLNHDIPIKTNDICLPALEKDKTTTTPPDSMKPDSCLLAGRVRVYTSKPTTVLPKGSVVLPIDDDLWIIVSLESN